jgi:hypothetical protein
MGQVLSGLSNWVLGSICGQIWAAHRYTQLALLLLVSLLAWAWLQMPPDRTDWLLAHLP